MVSKSAARHSKAATWQGGGIVVVADDVEKRLFLSTVVASLWPDADIVETDSSDPGVSARADLVVLADADGSALDWLEHSAGQAGAVIVVARELDDAFTAKALKLGAVDCVFEGSGFPGNLTSALLAEAGRYLRGSVATAGKSGFHTESVLHPWLDASAEDDHSVSGVLLVRALERQILPGIGADSLGTQVGAKVYADGAEVISTRVINGALRIHVEGMIGVVHAEMIAEHIAEFMREHASRSGQENPVAVGMSVSDFGERASLAELTRKAEVLCERAALEGGVSVHVAPCSEVSVTDDADDRGRGAHVDGLDDVVSAGTGGNALLHEGIRSLLMHGQLRPEFEPLRGKEAGFGRVVREQVELALVDEKGEPWPLARRDRFLAVKGHASSVDRILIAHALRRVRADRSRQLNLLVDISAESMRSAPFWRWLAQRLGAPEARGSASRLSFTLSMEVLRERKVDPQFLARFAVARRCGFVLRDIDKVDEALDFARVVPVQFLVVDMNRKRGRGACEEIKSLVKQAHADARRVALRRIHSSGDLLCAYSTNADFFQGFLSDQWEQIGLASIDGDTVDERPQWVRDYLGK